MSISKNFLKNIREKTGAVSFAESKYCTVSNYIDTGDYNLNRIISGSIYKGIPSGRVVIMAGESASGKSLLAAKVAANALNKHKYDHIFIFDSEGGAVKDMYVGQGCDPNMIDQILIESVEDATVKIIATYNALVEEKLANPDFRALCIVDSIGAMVAKKLLSDADKGKQVSDMGGKAKQINNMVKACTIPALKSDVSIIFLNHVYEDPSAMFTSKIKNQPGGLGLQFMGTVNIQCARNLDKDESADKTSYYKGTNLKFFTCKNRLIKPFYETVINIDFSEGSNPYAGLVDVAIQYGFIEQNGGYYKIPSYSDKSLRLADFIENKEIWDTFINKLDERSQKDMSYSREELLKAEETEKAVENVLNSVTENTTEEELTTKLSNVAPEIAQEVVKRRGRPPKAIAVLNTEVIKEESTDSPTNTSENLITTNSSNDTILEDNPINI